MTESVLTVAPATPLVAVTPVLPPVVKRQLPIKRWLLAGALAFALIAGGGALSYRHDHAAVHVTPIVALQPMPELPKPEPKVECPVVAPLVAPLPTIAPQEPAKPAPVVKPRPKREQRRP